MQERYLQESRKDKEFETLKDTLKQITVRNDATNGKMHDILISDTDKKVTKAKLYPRVRLLTVAANTHQEKSTINESAEPEAQPPILPAPRRLVDSDFESESESDIESEHGVNVKGKANAKAKKTKKNTVLPAARRKSNPLVSNDILAVNGTKSKTKRTAPVKKTTAPVKKSKAQVKKKTKPNFIEIDSEDSTSENNNPIEKTQENDDSAVPEPPPAESDIQSEKDTTARDSAVPEPPPVESEVQSETMIETMDSANVTMDGNTIVTDWLNGLAKAASKKSLNVISKPSAVSRPPSVSKPSAISKPPAVSKAIPVSKPTAGSIKPGPGAVSARTMAIMARTIQKPKPKPSPKGMTEEEISSFLLENPQDIFRTPSRKRRN